ncbi:amino acid/amide ABC transporter ATP-binding protein 1, HAAT family [Rhizobium sp. RU35A]|uniref:ABC transporter ATP-binding protein n=1 Tax=Rhizobium sp. RU35A TaxID=1907414 RepID=UPI000953A686|nr:ABC transporter ATP-binding protein [Rhizobium sp. RU35A]SIQ45014.1 amino acid/amide ABC transporter ATP-binding protein 1, HAAT family [Rhizobium sp. RU35A]
MTHTTDRNILSLRNVSKRFGGLSVITDVSFDVPAGARMALIGPNGAGKTTIFNLISGFYQPNEGEILLESRAIQGIPSRKRIGLGVARSFQNIRLMPHLSVVENVMLGQQARAGGILDMLKPLSLFGRSAWHREAEQLLADMDLPTYPGEVVATLPYGVRKKIEVVRALAARPKLLLLDEPAAGLNAAETDNLTAFLKRISETGVTLLVVEHDMGLVRRLCDDAVVLNFGRKIYDGPTATVQDNPLVLEAYLGPRHASKDRQGAAHVA